MKKKHRGYAGLLRNLVTPLGALLLGVAVFAATVSSTDNKTIREAAQERTSEGVSAELPTVIDLEQLGPFSTNLALAGRVKRSSPATPSQSDDLLPMFKATAPEGGSAAPFGRVGTGGGRGVGTLCSCDADCSDLDDINNCQVGVCDEEDENGDRRCAQENAALGTWCDLDGLFCTLDQCNFSGTCTPTESSVGVTRTPCAMECVGGTRPGLFCGQDSDCPGQGGTCQIKAGGVCSDTDDRCETAGDEGRCCSTDGTTCEYVTEAACLLLDPLNLWLRISDPSDLLDTCTCPKYSSGIVPQDVDGTAVGPILPSNKICTVGENICEDDGFGFCPKRCSATSDTPGEICSIDVDCALTGTCDDGSNDPCLPFLGGADCVGGGPCVPDNPASACLPDTCDVDPAACNPTLKFLSVGDDYRTPNASALRLLQFRFRGGIEDPDGVIVFEFFDDSTPPKFVTALATAPGRLGTRTWTVTLDCFDDCNPLQGEEPNDPPFIIPANGHIMMRSSRAAGGAAVAHWMSTTSPPNPGLNDVNRMWIDGDPNVNQLGTGNNVLAFELVGTKVDILGACCDPDGKDPCQDTTSWNCSECPDGTPCSRNRECGTDDFCLPINWQGPESHEDFVFSGGKLCATNVCTAGACCHLTTGECTEVDESDCLAGSVFSGFGTSCSPNCCDQPPPSGGADCACDTSQCSTDGGTTFTGVGCDPGNPVECVGGETCELLCSGPTPHVLSMPFQCEDTAFGGGALVPPVPCEPGDPGDALCAGVLAGATCVLPLFDFEKTITFTGDSSEASVDALEGDSCALDIFDVGWHEGFTLTECGIVTIDHCCDQGEQGIKTPVWIVLQDGCPCGAGAGQVRYADINIFGFRTGFGPGCNTQAECCADGNWSGTFTLRPGTYTWQIAGGGTCGGGTTTCDTNDDCLGGVQCLDTLGPYFGHATFERCPLAACCNGETCSITDEPACIDSGGNWLGNADSPVTRCEPGEQNVCRLGSCCTGPGACEDDSFHDELVECETPSNPAHVYHGGITCVEEPCPVCDFKNEGNCKFDDLGRMIFFSDRALVGNINLPDGCPAFIRRAENFRPASSLVRTICWWPAFLDPFIPNPNGEAECVDNPPEDDFWVRFYEDDDGLPGLERGPPGGQALIPTAKKPRDLETSRVWEYTATLTSPINVTPGECMWIEITGRGEFNGTNGCTVYLTESLEGDGYAMEDRDGQYGPEDVEFFDDNPDDFLADGADIAYCVSSGLFTNRDCDQGVMCCFRDGTSAFLTPMDCKNEDGVVLSGETNPLNCPTILDNNDYCTSPKVLTAADCGGDLTTCQVPFDNRSATTDGPVESCFAIGTGAANEFVKDLWYLYTPPCSGALSVSTCEGTNYDSMLAVFNGGDTCDCPVGGICGTGPGQDPTCVCDDDHGVPGCELSCFATSELTIPVASGGCYYIRVGGDRGSEVRVSGSGLLDIALSCPALQPPQPAPAPHDILKNRYVSIDVLTPNPAYIVFDIKATLTATLVNGVTAVGSEWWAQAPDAECVSIMYPTRPATPPDWTGCGTIHLTSCGIMPTSTYDIVVASGTAESGALAVSTQALPTGKKWWGDVVGQFDPEVDTWSPPEGLVTISDAFAAIKTFQNPSLVGPGCGTPPCNATHVSVTDVHPAGFPAQPWGTPNVLVNIDDVFAIIAGFQGLEFPGPQLGDCPLTPQP